MVELPESQAPVQEEKTDDREQVASSALPIPAEPAAPSLGDLTPAPAPEANAPAQPLSMDAAPSATPPPAAAPAAPPAKARSVKTPLQKEALEAAYRGIHLLDLQMPCVRLQLYNQIRSRTYATPIPSTHTCLVELSSPLSCVIETTQH